MFFMVAYHSAACIKLRFALSRWARYCRKVAYVKAAQAASIVNAGLRRYVIGAAVPPEPGCVFGD